MGRLWELVEDLDVKRAKTPATSTVMDSRSVAPPPTPATADPPRLPADPLADLLNTPVNKLTAPLAVESSVLGETVWLVANDRQATAIQAKGGTAYMPEEVAIIRELAASVRPEVWAERLRLIHTAKREMTGTLEACLRPDPKARLWHVLDEWVGLDEATTSAGDMTRLKDELMDLFATHPEAEGWYREWRATRPEAQLC